jgi:hypothetical protein
MHSAPPSDSRSLLQLVKQIRARRAYVLQQPDAFDDIRSSARIIAIHAPNGVVASLAKEVEVTAHDFCFRRHAESQAILQARLDDRIDRLEETIRRLA